MMLIRKIWMWVEVSFAVTALAVVVSFLIYAFKENSDGAAAWVQAIGSIAAIWGAFAVGKKQATNARQQAVEMAEESRKQTLELLARESRQRYRSISAVVSLASSEAMFLNITCQTSAIDEFVRLTTFPMCSVNVIVEALRRLPMHEIGSAVAVHRFSKALHGMEHLKSLIDELHGHPDKHGYYLGIRDEFLGATVLVDGMLGNFREIMDRLIAGEEVP